MVPQWPSKNYGEESMFLLKCSLAAGVSGWLYQLFVKYDQHRVLVAVVLVILLASCEYFWLSFILYGVEVYGTVIKIFEVYQPSYKHMNIPSGAEQIDP